MSDKKDALSYYKGAFSYRTPCEKYEVVFCIVESWIKVINKQQEVLFAHKRLSLGSGLEDIKMPMHSCGVIAFKSDNATCMLYNYQKNLIEKIKTKSDITHIDLFDSGVDKLSVTCKEKTYWYDIYNFFEE